jgi:hypothetical protein
MHIFTYSSLGATETGGSGEDVADLIAGMVEAAQRRLWEEDSRWVSTATDQRLGFNSRLAP